MSRKQIWASIAKDKAILRKKTANLSFAEKLAVVERMRDRDAVIRNARPGGPRK